MQRHHPDLEDTRGRIWGEDFVFGAGRLKTGLPLRRSGWTLTGRVRVDSSDELHEAALRLRGAKRECLRLALSPVKVAKKGPSEKSKNISERFHRGCVARNGATHISSRNWHRAELVGIYPPPAFISFALPVFGPD